MARIERVYNIPLRKEFHKAPRYKKTKKAVTALREFLVKHMKSDNVSIGKYLNEELWKHGIKNPPHHVSVNVVKDDDGKVTAELVGAPVEEVKKDDKKDSKKKIPQDLKDVKAALEGSLKKAEAKDVKEEKKSEEKKSSDKDKVKK